MWYSILMILKAYKGVLRGALEMVNIQIQAAFVSDTLKGDDQTELRVKWIKNLDEQVPPSDD